MKNNKFYMSAVLAAMFLSVNNSYSMEKVTFKDIANYKQNPEKILGKEATGNLLSLFIPNKDNKYEFEIGELVVVPRSSGKLTYGILIEPTDEIKSKGLIRVQLENGMAKDLSPKYLYKSIPISPAPETIEVNRNIFKYGQQIDKETALSIATFSKNNKFDVDELIVVPLVTARSILSDPDSMKDATFFTVGSIVSFDKAKNKYVISFTSGTEKGGKVLSGLPEFLGKINK
jgi:hypothetical protein